MKIITAKKGDSYESIEKDLRAILNNKIGDEFLDNENCFKKDTEILFVKKNKKMS